MPRLALLALRRTLPPWCLACLLALLVLAARATHGGALAGADERALAGVRALARQNVWSVLAVFAPLFFLQAARLGTGAARAWLAPTPASRLALALALALGSALACAAATILTALVSEAATVSAGDAWRRARTAESPSALLQDDDPRVQWSVTAPAPGERLRLWTTVAIGSGPAVTARLTARAGPRSSTVEARIAGRTALELAPPLDALGARAPGHAATLELELERIGPGALLVLLPDALQILAPATSERLAALELGTRALLFLSTGCVLALGLGCVLRPALAAGLVLALAFSSWTSARAVHLVPGADLPRAWDELAGGLVPASVPPGTLAGTLVLVALGLGLYARAPRAHASDGEQGGA